MKSKAKAEKVASVPSGSKVIDRLCAGGIPRGTNIFLYGEIGTGKSAFCRRFIAEGLRLSEPCLYVTLDEDPARVREKLELLLGKPLADYEKRGLFRLVDAYSCAADMASGERYQLKGKLGLDRLSALIEDAGEELGHVSHKKAGGRRIFDSITSMMSNFELPKVQNFVAKNARAAAEFGGATSLFILEQGTVEEMAANNIRYLLDGEINFKKSSGVVKVRIANMKWIDNEITAWTKYD